jgi:hypothetical protein
MVDKVVGFPKRPKTPRVNYKGFAKEFHRVEVQRQLEPVRTDELKLLPNLDSPPIEWYTARYTGPGEHYQEVVLHSLRELGIGPELLLYRVLRDLFGPPDNVTVGLPAGFFGNGRELKDDEGPVLWEWAFMLAGKSDAVYEIRKQPGTQLPHLAIWFPRLTSAGTDRNELLVSEFKQFTRELKKTLEQSQSLVDKRELKRSAVSVGPMNIYADLLAAGDEQITAASLQKSQPKSSTKRSTMLQVTNAQGTFYMAAVVQYLLALEAYVNVVSELLKKGEFQDSLFARLTTDADFESRLLSLSLFCRGFARSPFSPDTPLFKRVRQLRTFCFMAASRMTTMSCAKSPRTTTCSTGGRQSMSGNLSYQTDQV